MRINPSDLMLINRAIANEDHPRDTAWFVDAEGEFRRYKKRRPHIMSAKETLTDIERSVTRMLESLPKEESIRLRKTFEGEQYKRDKFTKIALVLLGQYVSEEMLKEYAPHVLKKLLAR